MPGVPRVSSEDALRLPRSTISGTHRSAITVGQIVEKWLDVAEVEDTTRQRYRYKGLIRLYIGPMLTAKLDAELLERLCTRLSRGEHEHPSHPATFPALSAASSVGIPIPMRSSVRCVVQQDRLRTVTATSD